MICLGGWRCASRNSSTNKASILAPSHAIRWYRVSCGPPNSSRLSVDLPASGAQSFRRADNLPASTAIVGSWRRCAPRASERGSGRRCVPSPRPLRRMHRVLRADSGFAREALMSWCEANGVDFVFGLARNERLVAEIASELAAAEAESKASGQPARRFKQFQWSTRDSWSRQRRVVAKAEWTAGAANPRFVVTSLSGEDAAPQRLYEEIYCARGDMENRIKECQLDLFADRTSAATMRANQLRLWFASMAYVLLCALRRLALQQT